MLLSEVTMMTTSGFYVILSTYKQLNYANNVKGIIEFTWHCFNNFYLWGLIQWIPTVYNVWISIHLLHVFQNKRYLDYYLKINLSKRIAKRSWAYFSIQSSKLLPSSVPKKDQHVSQQSTSLFSLGFHSFQSSTTKKWPSLPKMSQNLKICTTTRYGKTGDIFKVTAPLQRPLDFFVRV